MNKKGYIGEFADTYKKDLNLPDEVKIFDTTLRDGEQTPGVSFTPDQKIRIARQLDELQVDVIEAGFPIVSKGEKNSVKKIVDEDLDTEICALSRSSDEDLETALDCNVDSIHLFIATSDLHLEKKLDLTREEALEKAVTSVEKAKENGVIVEFSAEDATRTELGYLKEIYEAVENAGADRINIPDTVGVATPKAMRNLTEEIKKVVDIPISVHCHDDFGLAVSNSVAAVETGAEQIHAAINGLGERAGNASLEEVVMTLRSLYDIKPRVKTEALVKTSSLLERITGIQVPPNKAIVGDNAFAHEAGIHVDGVLKSPGTYEALSPELVGHHRRITLGKHTGKKSVKKQLDELEIETTKEQLEEITARLKDIGDKGKIITDADLRAIAESVVGTLPREEKAVKLKEATVTTGSTVTPTSSIRLSVKGEDRIGSATGVGPVDAAIKALRDVMGEISELSLKEYHLDAITGGSDALADVTVKLEDKDNNLYIAKGVRDDVVLASVEAMVNGINRYFARKEEES
ncbi:citramalate synthase [candidate division MSBL1 archaeon SCGC-AAA382F02]|uniref:Citramalate synthase n=1 Tax=candidate division MSBL1 archaeon SCGC-AAA382F02 TaxID=1698282 RepID=A0A133VIP8_9EURY|nr:citramalate synthase [candidate division MSBL1 archaeon SCGC-AAA382F02]